MADMKSIQAAFEEFKGNITNCFKTLVLSKKIITDLSGKSEGKFNSVNEDGSVSDTVSAGISGVLPVKNGGTGATAPYQILKNLGIIGYSFTGDVTYDNDDKIVGIELPTKEIITCPLTGNVKDDTNDRLPIDSNFFEITDDGGILIITAGYYMISGSVYIEQTPNGDAFARSCYIYSVRDYVNNDEDNPESELCASTVVCHGDTNITGAVSISPKVVYINDGTTLYLRARSQKTDGLVYPGNSATYLTIFKLGYNS